MTIPWTRNQTTMYGNRVPILNCVVTKVIIDIVFEFASLFESIVRSHWTVSVQLNPHCVQRRFLKYCPTINILSIGWLIHNGFAETHLSHSNSDTLVSMAY